MSEREDSSEIQLNRLLGELILLNKKLDEVVTILMAIEAKQK